MMDSALPLLRIWAEPRATIRSIVDSDPRRGVIPITLLGGALGSLESSWFTALGRPEAITPLWPLRVAAGAAFGAVWAVVGLYGIAWASRLFCRMLGGVAGAAEMRAAMAWSTVPAITASIISIASVLAGTVTPPRFTQSGIHFVDRSSIELGLLNFVLLMWGFVVELKCVGEVNRFSAWRSLGALLMMIGVTVAILLLVLFAAGLLLFHQ
jgi:hypothetical protein